MAGPNQRANVGQAVTLQGDGDDADGDSLDFDWSFDARPVGSTAVIQDSGRATATFVPDLPGRYIVRLTVDDGRGGTANDGDDHRHSSPHHC